LHYSAGPSGARRPPWWGSGSGDGDGTCPGGAGTSRGAWGGGQGSEGAQGASPAVGTGPGHRVGLSPPSRARLCSAQGRQHLGGFRGTQGPGCSSSPPSVGSDCPRVPAGHQSRGQEDAAVPGEGTCQRGPCGRCRSCGTGGWDPLHPPGCWCLRLRDLRRWAGSPGSSGAVPGFAGIAPAGGGTGEAEGDAGVRIRPSAPRRSVSLHGSLAEGEGGAGRGGCFGKKRLFHPKPVRTWSCQGSGSAGGVLGGCWGMLGDAGGFWGGTGVMLGCEGGAQHGKGGAF